MPRTLNILDDLSQIQDRGSDIVVNAPPQKIVRIYSKLARWARPVGAKQTQNQQRLAQLLDAPPSLERTPIRILSCSDFQTIQKSEESIWLRKFVRSGADVRLLPNRHFPIRLTSCAKRLILGINEADRAGSGDPLINYAIYLESDEDDPIFHWANVVFDAEFQRAAPLGWDAQRSQLVITDAETVHVRSTGGLKT